MRGRLRFQRALEYLRTRLGVDVLDGLHQPAERWRIGAVATE